MGLRTVFLGTPAFGARLLRVLAASPHRPSLAVSQPDRPAGRGRRIRPTPVHQAALDLGIPLIQPRAVRGPGFAGRLRKERPDVLITAAYGRILTPQVLEIPRIAPINVHGSLLPRWRGAAPVQHALLAGDDETGVSIFRMAENLDAGDVYLRRSLPVPPGITSGELLERVAELAEEALLDALDGLEEGRLPPMPQDPAAVTWAPPLTKEDGLLPWLRPALELERRIRALQPWPGAYTHLRGERLQIRRATVVPLEAAAAPGAIVSADPKRGLEAAAGEDALRLELLVQPGRRPVSGAELVRGSRIEVGEMLGAGPREAMEG